MPDQTADLADVLRRLEVLEAESAVVKVLYTLAVTLDYGDNDGWLACFSPDVVFRMVEVSETDQVERVRHEGIDALTAFIPGHTHAPQHFHKHLVGDPIVEVAESGDRATSVSYLTRIDKGAEGPYLWSFGRYLDEFARGEDGRWRMSARTIEVESRAVPVKASDIGSKH